MIQCDDQESVRGANRGKVGALNQTEQDDRDDELLSHGQPVTILKRSTPIARDAAILQYVNR
jgi:hypothetical protein